jgi:universal stress protein A
MAKYERILLAVDLKAEDDAPVSEKAMAIAKSTGAEVSVVHVVEPIYNYGIPPGTEGKFDQWEKELETSAKSQLKKIGEKLSIPTNRQYMGVGQIKQQILRTAEMMNADLIVLGTHSRHGLNKLIMGDTAEDMLQSAKCDVLAVHINK